MGTVLALMNRNRKLFFKDKGMLFTSMITPVVLIVLYATFLAKVFRDSFTAAIPDMITISDKLINGIVAAQLTASLMAVSCITVTFCVNMILLVLFGSTLSSIISFPLTTQGQLSAVGTIVSAGYGFICGAYMPISNFGLGLQKVLSYLPSTYATSLIKNHMLQGVFREMERKHYPGEMIEVIRETLDCNPVFHGNVVSVNQMIGIMMGSIAVFGIIYYFITLLPEGEGGR